MAKKKQAKEDIYRDFSYYCRQCGDKRNNLKECPKRCKICNSTYLTINDHKKMRVYFNYNEYIRG